jgi:hypothetical protein
VLCSTAGQPPYTRVLVACHRCRQPRFQGVARQTAPTIVQLPEEPFTDLNGFLIHGIEPGILTGNIERPNRMGQFLTTMAMPDPHTALEPDPGVLSAIPLDQQRAFVFDVAADLAQQQCADKDQLMEVLRWLQIRRSSQRPLAVLDFVHLPVTQIIVY